MPRGIKNVAETVDAVNGVEYDRLTPGFDEDDGVDLTRLENEGRYKVVTPRAASFTAYGIKFIEGIGRTDDLALAEKFQAEFKYKIVDTLKPGQRTPVPEPLPETS